MKTFRSNLPGCPLGLYRTVICADSPGATDFTVHVAVAHEHVETRRRISIGSSPTFMNVYMTFLGASSSVIGSATICFVSKTTDAESALRRGFETSSTFSREMILIWAEAVIAKVQMLIINMIPLNFILKPSGSVCVVANCDYEFVGTRSCYRCFSLAFLNTLYDHLSVHDLGCCD